MVPLLERWTCIRMETWSLVSSSDRVTTELALEEFLDGTVRCFWILGSIYNAEDDSIFCHQTLHCTTLFRW